jgi:serine/threonine-protein kinase
MSSATISSFVEGLFLSQVLDKEQREEVIQLQESSRDARTLAQELLRREWLTAFQINQIFLGKGGGLQLGPFLLLERIGEGGMGQVYKARQKLLNRFVALKVIRKECLGNPKSVLRFLREIRAASQLCHPHIVRAYDADQVNGTYYFAMEFIEGSDLSNLVKDNGPLPVDQACEYIRQAALGLQHASERGMVHRDIKPANLLVTRAVSSDRRRSSGAIRRPDLNAKRSSAAIPRPDLEYPWGVVKILDMGLARCVDPHTGTSGTVLTQDGTIMGTPEFIAPEQARDAHQSDTRADLYSLGCTMYYLLSGQAPFPNGSFTEKLLHHQFDAPDPLPLVRRENLLARHGSTGPLNGNEQMLYVPKPIVDVVSRLMEKKPEDRFQTPQDLAGTLQTLLQQWSDGTIPRRAAELPNTVLINPSAVPAAAAVLLPARRTGVKPPPIVALQPRQPDRSSLASFTLVLALVTGFVFLFSLTIIAALLSRSSLVEAHPFPAEPPAKSAVKESTKNHETGKKMKK